MLVRSIFEGQNTVFTYIINIVGQNLDDSSKHV